MRLLVYQGSVGATASLPLSFRDSSLPVHVSRQIAGWGEQAKPWPETGRAFGSPYIFIGFGAMDVTKPYRFYRVLAMGVSKP